MASGSRLFFVCMSIAVFLTVLLLLPVISILPIWYSTSHKQPELCLPEDDDFVPINRGLITHLSDALKFSTISYEEHKYNKDALSNYLLYIKKTFPLIHSSKVVTVEVVNNYSLLYHIQGANDSLLPYMLAGHLDVVPVEESAWKVPPFSGEVRDGYIWGRGALDCKDIVMGILESLEYLLEAGYKFQRSFYVAFGHDEEVSGLDGARQIAALLKSRNVKLEYVLDEGSMMLDNIFPGLDFPVAFVSVSEKGSLNLKLEVQDTPGHSSFPKKEPVIVILSKALSKLEGDVFPSLFGTGPELNMLSHLGECNVPIPLKIVSHNLMFSRFIVPWFMKNPVQSAMHKTTVAVTMVQGGYKMNVLPSVASANVNLRVHPGQTIKEAFDFVTKLIDDERVNVSVLSSVPPHPQSSASNYAYNIIKSSIRQMYNDSCVVPSLLIANTDTRWYLDLSRSIYRFSLARITFKETSCIHGHNERISVENYVKLVNFYLHLMKNSDEIHDLKHLHDEL